MRFTQYRWMMSAVLASAAVTVIGCHGGNGSTVPTPPPVSNNSEKFSALANQVYAMSANSTPFNFDSAIIVYDVNDDPTAFNALLM